MEQLPQIPAKSSIFVLTGAGISKESGIETFRDSDGLWNNHRIEDVASPEGFYRNLRDWQHPQSYDYSKAHQSL